MQRENARAYDRAYHAARGRQAAYPQEEPRGNVVRALGSISVPRGNTVVLVLIYMLLVYTTVQAFTVSAYDDFSVGGSRQDLFNKGDVDFQTSIITVQQQNNLTGSDAWDYLNSTYGLYQGENFLFNWLDTGWYHVWVDQNGIETTMLSWKFDKFLAGTLDYSDNTFQESAGNVLGSIWNSISYVFGFLTFNIVGDMQLSDGSSIPWEMQWLPMLMVIIPWILITLWILPYIIDLLKAIGGLIPLT